MKSPKNDESQLSFALDTERPGLLHDLLGAIKVAGVNTITVKDATAIYYKTVQPDRHGRAKA